MHLYEMTTVRGKTLSVFAADFDEAATLLFAWHLVNEEAPIPALAVRKLDPLRPGVNTSHLLEALSRETPGFGRYDPAVGWEIVSPLDWEEEG